MPRYDYVLFDADNTLYDFDRAEREALLRVLAGHGLPTEQAAVDCYLAINRDLWGRFDRGEVRREWLVVERFAALCRTLGCAGDPQALNRDYLNYLGEGSFLLPGAEQLCRALARHCTLAVVTNGVARAQRRRFEGSALKALIPWLFISEEVGASKPDPAFFQAVFHAMGIRELRRAVVVGDNLLTDVRGGINAGVDTVWFNPNRLPGVPGISPTWTLDSFLALEALLLA